VWTLIDHLGSLWDMAHGRDEAEVSEFRVRIERNEDGTTVLVGTSTGDHWYPAAATTATDVSDTEALLEGAVALEDIIRQRST
jgi:hypothetical protein